jgi:hypothetical protein
MNEHLTEQFESLQQQLNDATQELIAAQHDSELAKACAEKCLELSARYKKAGEIWYAATMEGGAA